MPTTRITDTFGLIVETETAEGASITRCFRDTLSLNLRKTNFQLRNTTLKGAGAVAETLMGACLGLAVGARVIEQSTDRLLDQRKRVPNRPKKLYS